MHMHIVPIRAFSERSNSIPKGNCPLTQHLNALSLTEKTMSKILVTGIVLLSTVRKYEVRPLRLHST